LLFNIQLREVLKWRKKSAMRSNRQMLGLDEKWGLDHGAWSVIKHMYPNADVPVVQFSIDRRKDPNYHFELANELSFLRRKGVLIVGSGNMIHNLAGDCME
jgi:4,5-DOPA dioxygenase extradiol